MNLLFFETFANTALLRSIFILLNLAASLNWETASIDVKTAFLYSPMKQLIYLRRPPGLSSTVMPDIVKLNKCLYGLKQAAHEWLQLLDTTLKLFGFKQVKSDECLYIIHHPFDSVTHTLILGIFVDDILCLGSTPTIIHWFTSQMTSKFTITIKDNVDSFLGMQISRNRDNKTISLSQPGYIESILSKFNTNPCPNDKLPTTPMMQSDLIDDLPTHLTPSQQTLYMKIVGSLLFLATRTRPDISFVVNYLTLYMTKATQHHLNICYRVLNYLSKTKTLPLIFNGTGGHNFSVMVDAS